MLNRFLKSRAKAFAEDTRGYITVEAMIVIPALLWLFGVGWVYFDVFRQQSVSQKANYTVGDVISRQTDPIDQTYLDSVVSLYEVLTRGSSSDDVGMAITVATYDADNRTWSVAWSASTDGVSSVAAGDINSVADRLPIAAPGEQVVIVQTWDSYTPIFEVGLNAFEINTFSFTRPRYAPQIVFDGQATTMTGKRQRNANNGWGNGDQDAPGSSGCNNNAENATDCSS